MHDAIPVLLIIFQIYYRITFKVGFVDKHIWNDELF